MDLVNPSEFARRKQVSVTTVRNGLRAGRIIATAAGDIDWTTQSEAWDVNQKHPQKRPTNLKGGRPVGVKDGKPRAPRRPSVPPAPPPGQPPGMSLAEVQRARELVKLQLDNLKLKEAQGELVSAAKVEKEARALAGQVVATLYNIPDRIADELAGMTDATAIAALLIREIDVAVETLRSAHAG